jgi:two-component system nitrogen regulation response regulator NtrX
MVQILSFKFRSIAPERRRTHGSTLHEARAQYEREFILSKLKENNWNISQTARLLGLELAIYRKMKAYGIEKY